MARKVTVGEIKHIQQSELNGLTKIIYQCCSCKSGKSERSRSVELNIVRPLQTYEIKRNQNTVNNPRNNKLIQNNLKEVQLMANSMKEEMNAPKRNLVELGGAYLVQGVNQFFNQDLCMKAVCSMHTALQMGNKQSLKSILVEFGDLSQGAMTAAGVVFAAELCYQTFRLIRHEISLKNYAKKVMGSLAMSAGAAVGNVGGAAIGAAIGNFVFPFVGPAVGGALGGLLGAIYVGFKAKQCVEEMAWFNDKNEQKYRQKLINEALIAFGFTSDDLVIENVFNKKEIARRFKSRAKEAHPDRPGGSEEKFLRLSAQMSILLAVLGQDHLIKEETSKRIKAISLYSF